MMLANRGSQLRRLYATALKSSQCYPSVTQQRHYSSGGSSGPCRVGCASGFWGDTPTAVGQLVSGGQLDYLILDYLSEITMSLLTAAKAKNPDQGYAPDFVAHAVGPNLKAIKQQGIRVITNAGGINPAACAAALQAVAAKQGLDIKVGVVTGDDLLPQLAGLEGLPDLTTGAPLPKAVHSINAYTGAGSIVRALELGADIVVTGRCADSSLALAPAAFHHGWSMEQLTATAGASIAGHLLECGAQSTGGNTTDWRGVQGWSNMGFPIASISSDGSCVLTKPPNTGGRVSVGGVGEQLLYEIGDPRAYVLPDLAVDLTGVTLRQEGEDAVSVTGARGLPATDTYKVGATYLAGFKATAVCLIGGRDAAEKARITGLATLERCNRLLGEAGLPPITRYHLQVMGHEESYGPHASHPGPREAVLWLGVHHASRAAVQLFSRELAAAGTGGVPGLMGLVGGRPKPQPVLRLHSSLVPKKDVPLRVTVGDHSEEYVESPTTGAVPYDSYVRPDQPTTSFSSEQPLTGSNTYRLEDIALTRSGDKGDSCNIGVLARHPALLPLLQQRLTRAAVAGYMAHVFPQDVSPESCVARYEVPGVHGLNFVLQSSLGGGGVASLRPDPQGKAYGQMLLDFPLHDMPDITKLTS